MPGAAEALFAHVLMRGSSSCGLEGADEMKLRHPRASREVVDAEPPRVIAVDERARVFNTGGAHGFVDRPITASTTPWRGTVVP